MRYRQIYQVTLLAVAAAAAAGCSTARKVQVGAITFTNATGTVQTALSTLAAGQVTYLDVSLTNDTSFLGANWSVTCESALPPGTPLPPGQTQDTSCGTLTPMHTSSGPIPSFATSGAGYVTIYTAPLAPPKGGTVTLYATSTAEPSQSSSLTLTIH